MPGVRQVASEIKSPDQLGDAEIWDGGEQASTTEDVKAAASDAWITTKVKVRLMAEPGLSPLGVNVDTRGGVVTLFGSVPTQDLKARATTQAKAVAGVKGVENELQIVPDSMAKHVETKDEQVLDAVKKQLGARDSLEDSEHRRRREERRGAADGHRREPGRSADRAHGCAEHPGCRLGDRRSRAEAAPGMTGERVERRALRRRASRGAALPLLAAVLLGAVAWLPACQREENRVEEAIEELKDEAGDAKKEIEDEVDDHT